MLLTSKCPLLQFHGLLQLKQQLLQFSFFSEGLRTVGFGAQFVVCGTRFHYWTIGSSRGYLHFWKWMVIYDELNEPFHFLLPRFVPFAWEEATSHRSFHPDL